MNDPTAGRSAGTPLNAEFDPMGPSDKEHRRSASDDPETAAANRTDDPTSGRFAGTRRNAEQDPTRAAGGEPDADLPVG